MKEKISALMDDQLDDGECDGCFKALKVDKELRETWNLYHLVGDAMRGHTVSSLKSSFSTALAAEPTVLSPRRTLPIKQPTRWALSAAASVAAVGFVGWMAYPFFGPQSEQIATAQPNVPQAEVRVIPASQNMDDYQLAHQRFASGFGMSGVAPYVRNVSSGDGQR
ncbi:MAG TPA: sigma-E factor negative regulatory protein [Burkholderiales bacterium]|nr:sigma-E factor negative regulatory protein [Burkholderiales bacterium]